MTNTTCAMDPSYEDFLFMDPETGELVCMTLDDKGYRVLGAAEVAQGLSVLSADMLADSIQSCHEELDAFIWRHEKSYPSVDATEWDGRLDIDDAMTCPAPSM